MGGAWDPAAWASQKNAQPQADELRALARKGREERERTVRQNLVMSSDRAPDSSSSRKCSPRIPPLEFKKKKRRGRVGRSRGQRRPTPGGSEGWREALPKRLVEEGELRLLLRNILAGDDADHLRLGGGHQKVLEAHVPKQAVGAEVSRVRLQGVREKWACSSGTPLISDATPGVFQSQGEEAACTRGPWPTKLGAIW